MQGRWWPTWPRAARDGPGADDIARWLLPLPPTCAIVGSPARASAVAGRNPIRPRMKGSRGDAESGLGDRTTPAADYPTQRSGGRHMPHKLLRRALPVRIVCRTMCGRTGGGFALVVFFSLRRLHPSGFPITCSGASRAAANGDNDSTRTNVETEIFLSLSLLQRVTQYR